MSEVFIAFRLSGAAAAVLHDFSFAGKKKCSAGKLHARIDHQLALLSIYSL